MWRYIKVVLSLLFIFLIFFSLPVSGEDRLNVRGESMRVVGEENIMVLEGDVFLQYGDLIVHADYIEFQIEEMIFVARGNVRLQERGQFLECEELTYRLDENVSIFVEAKARFYDEEKDQDLFFFSPYMEGDGEKFHVIGGSVTPCELDKPHIFFRAEDVEIYPGDYLVATNVVFWELGGLLPLFYWPVLYLSLEEDQDIVPSFGYSQQRGFFMKLAYHYFDVEGRGIFYLDYYSITGLGTGIRHYYLDNDQGEGSFYLYVLENRQKDTGWDYFVANLSHKQTIVDWRTNFKANYRLVPDDRERVELSLSTVKQWDRSRLDYTGDFQGEQRLAAETWARSLSSKVNYRHSLPLNSVYTMNIQHRLVEDREGFFSIYEGEGKWTQRGSAHTLDLLLIQDRPQRYERDADPRFTALPEVRLNLNPSRLYTFPDPFRGFINPLRLDALVANYTEEGTGTEGIKLRGEFRYNQSFRPFSPLTINLTQQGKTNFYYTEGGSIEDPDYSLGVSETRVSTTLQPFRGLNLGLDYNLRTVDGSSPFSFDRESPQNDLGGNLSYSWRTGRARLSSSYNLLTERYSDLKGDLTLTPFQGFKMEVTANYSLEDQAFKGLVAKYNLSRDHIRHDLAVTLDGQSFRGLETSYRLQFDTFKHDLALSVDRDFEIEQVDTKLLWDIGDLLEIGFRASYLPQQQRVKEGELVLIWDLHCREIALSYDHIKEEYWIRYSIPAFPGQKVSLGASPDEAMLFDLDLGGIFDD